MKIAILSMQRIVNFGSVLQAYSLRELIRDLIGAQVEFLDIDRSESVSSHKSRSDHADYETPAAYPPGLLQRGKRFLIAKLSAANKRKIRRFMETQLELTEKNSRDHFDWVVIGSDEVFNHSTGVSLQLHGKIPNADRVITYAAACGNALAADIAPEDRAAVEAAMDRLEAISVRDEATAQYVQTLTSRPVERHLDPVLTGYLYKRPHRPVPIKRYLLVYAYGHRIRTDGEIRAIQTYAHSRGLKTVAMGGSQFWTDLYIPADPMRILDYFYYADCVVTDTFHGTVFSVLQHRPFAVLSRQSNREKITGLLEDLALTDRLVTDPKELEKTVSAPIDYDRVEEILNRERERTRQYLCRQLGGRK